MQEEDVAEWRGAAVRVAGVEGAPGDGDSSLAAAMRQALAVAGLSVLDDGDTAAAYRVSGDISLLPAGPGQEEVRVSWLIVDLDGRDLGIVAQANAVPTGSLDGTWNAVALRVVAAALPAILDLLEQAETAAP